MKVDGRCHCGAISFEGEIDPETIDICHCTDCQMFTGSAFRTSVATPADRFTLRGEPVTYVKTAASGNKRRQAFCGACGTPVFSCDPVNPQRYTLRVGTLTQRQTLPPPRSQIWRQSALRWVDAIGEIPPKAKQ